MDELQYNTVHILFDLIYPIYNDHISDKPHNPMINSGAIIVSSLLKPELSLPDRFDWVNFQLLYHIYKNKTFCLFRSKAKLLSILLKTEKNMIIQF